MTQQQLNKRQRDGLGKVRNVLTHVINDALEPALRGATVPGCEHLFADPGSRGPILCCGHPWTLLCDADGCVFDHWLAEPEHHREHTRGAPCFLCERGTDTTVAPIYAQVTLTRAVPLDGGGSVPAGVSLATLPAVYLCDKHAGAIVPPLRGVWPSPRQDSPDPDAAV